MNVAEQILEMDQRIESLVDQKLALVKDPDWSSEALAAIEGEINKLAMRISVIASHAIKTGELRLREETV